MLRRFLSELRRRNVLKSMAIYTAAALAAIEVASSLFPLFRIPAIYQTLVAVILLAGFPVVFYLSWFYELEDWRLVPAIESEEDAPPAPFGGTQWLILIAILLGSSAASFWVYQQVAIDAKKAASGMAQQRIGTSIAVMPFRDGSPDQEQTYLAEGLADDITSLLGQQNGLQVASTSSTFIAAKRGLDPQAIGKALSVASLLNGSVVVNGNRLKLMVELVDTANGKTLWTQTYTRTLNDVFSTQEEIARAIANQLNDVYLESGSITSQARTASTDAYVFYLKGRELYRKQTAESMKEARQFFEQAIGIDPEYSMAYVGLADSLALLAKGKSKFGVIEPDIAAQLANQSLAKALVRNPDIAEAYAVQGKITEFTQEYEKALAMYDKAITLNSNLAIAHMWRYLVLDKLNRKIEAMETLERAHKLDPLSITTMFNHGYELSRRGQLAAAASQYEKITEDYPDSPMGFQGLADVHVQKGELANALLLWRKAKERSPDNPNLLESYVSVLMSLGMLDVAQPYTNNDYYKPTLLLRSGRYPELFKEMAFRLNASPDDPWLQFEAGWYEYLAGDKNHAAELVIKAGTQFSDNDLYDAPSPMCSPAIEIAYALKQNGKNVEAKKLADQCQTRVERAMQQGIHNQHVLYLTARLSALNEDSKSTAIHLERCIDAGWTEWWTAQDPLFQPYHNDPKISSLFQRIEHKLTEEKQKAQAIVQTNAQ